MATQLDQIIDGATDDNVSTGNLLRKVKVVAHRLGSTEVSEWVDRELNGYEGLDAMPSYRREISINVLGEYIGPGMSRSAVLESLGEVLDDVRVVLFTVSLGQSIAELEELAHSSKTMGVPWSPSQIGVYSQWVREGKVFGERNMRLLSANRVVTNGVVKGVIDNARNSALDFALQLQSADPEAGSLNGPTIGDPPVATVVNHFTTVTGIANMQYGDHNSQTVTVEAGDLLGLLAAAKQLGVDGDLAKELAAAVTAPEKQRDGKVKRFLKKLGSGSLVLAGGVTGNVVADQLTPLITAYLGG